MSQNIKNTLYRFVTMRSPELIGDKEKAAGFIKYPGAMSDSPILTAMDVSDTNETAAKTLSEAVKNYIPKYQKIEDLKTEVNGFSDFSKWLITNRKRLTVAETDAKISELHGEKPTNKQMLVIWDDLHNSIVANGSPYLRDLLLSYIVAEFFVTRFTLLEKTDDAYRKLAQSRVVISSGLFDKPVVTDTAERSFPLLEKDFQKSMDVAMATEENKELQQLLTEVKKAKNRYTRENEKAQEAYQQKYDLLVRKAYDDTAVLLEEKFDNQSVADIPVVEKPLDLELLQYEYTPIAQLTNDAILKTIDNDSVTYIKEIQASEGYDTFEEMEQHLRNEIKNNVAIIAENQEVGNKQVNVMGAILPLGEKAVGDFFTFSCCSRRSLLRRSYRVTMTIKVPNAAYTIAKASYEMIYADGTKDVGTQIVENMPNGDLAITFFGGARIRLKENIKEFKGEFTFVNGEVFTFSLPNFNRNSCSLGQLIAAVVDDPIDPDNPTEEDVPTGFGIRRLGIADYRKVEQEVCCYVPGEVSHIENIMAREYKEKSTRRLRRQEDTLTTSAEQEIETLTETTSTARFEMNHEVASVIAKDRSFAAAAGVSYSNAGFTASANASFANNTSKEESDLQAISQAQELTERALDRVVQKVREERITKVVEEYEENSSHGFDNRKGDKHISGVYRWVDKIYKNSILNYGKRLMYEFMIPEPAAFHEEAIKRKGNIIDEILVKPVDPRVSSIQNISDYRKITENTLAYWGGVYNADIDSMPLENITVSKAYSKDDTSINNGRFGHAGHESVEIPEGYLVSNYFGYFTYERGIHDGTWRRNGIITVGGRKHSFTSQTIGESITLSGSFYSQKISNSLEFSITSWDVGVYAFNLYATCELSSEARQAWQIKAFDAIIDAYEDKLAEYYEKLEAAKALQEETLKINPGFYRQIEKTVLRKNCITYLLGQDKVGVNMLTGDQNKLEEIRPDHTNGALDAYAARVKFFEQAFEWDIMSYQFYPFYWANKEKWGEKYVIENNDPLFKAFLQSGMARVVITVRPGFEEMVNWYLATGQIWNGGQVPTVDDEEFVSIVEELQNPESIVEETWETRVPTSLTVIQAGSIGLNVEGLPCDSECADWTQFDSDLNPIQQTDELIGGNDATTQAEGVGADTVGDTAVR